MNKHAQTVHFSTVSMCSGIIRGFRFSMKLFRHLLNICSWSYVKWLFCCSAIHCLPFFLNHGLWYGSMDGNVGLIMEILTIVRWFPMEFGQRFMVPRGLIMFSLVIQWVFIWQVNLDSLTQWSSSSSTRWIWIFMSLSRWFAIKLAIFWIFI